MRTRNKHHSAKLRMRDAIKYKRIEELMNSDNPSESVEMMTKKGIEKIVAIIMHVIRRMLATAGHLALQILVILAPILVFIIPVLVIIMCMAGFAGDSSARNKNLVFGITGDLNYVSYRQGIYEKQYGETGWCGITTFADMLASYGCTSPYNPTELINPCNTVKYADESGTAIIGKDDGVHYLNADWVSSICGEYGLEFESVTDTDYYGQALLDWVNEKLDDGWQVSVCFDKYSKYESGAYITKQQHYIWLVCYADSNHETNACIDPGNGCADKTFLSDVKTDNGYRDLIVNKSQILNYTANSNVMTGFAVRMAKDKVGMR